MISPSSKCPDITANCKQEITSLLLVLIHKQQTRIHFGFYLKRCVAMLVLRFLIGSPVQQDAHTAFLQATKKTELNLAS